MSSLINCKHGRHEKSRPHSCREHGTVIEDPFNHRRLRLGSTSLVESSTAAGR